MAPRHFRLLSAALFALLFPIGSVQHASADDWMGRIPDDALFYQLSIPGTHDSATGHGFTGFLQSFGESFGRCQDLTLSQQWESGIRAFDLRPCVEDDVLRINHGIIPTQITLEEAFTTLCRLLDEHPTEAAIVIIRHESDGDDNNSLWNTRMQQLLARDDVQSHAVAFNAAVRMSQLRGKLLILSRDAYATTPTTGGFIRNWSHSAAFADQRSTTIQGRNSQSTCYVQDFYDLSASGAKEQKTQSILTLMRYTCEVNATRLWAINHTSGYSLTTDFFGSTVSTTNGYRDNAATQNRAVTDFLVDHSGPTGIVMMDFGGVDRSGNYEVAGLTLTQAIIANNFRTSDYARAIATLTNGKKYHISTLLDAIPYYLTTDGHLTTASDQAGVFTFRRVRGEEFGYGFKLSEALFTNPDLQDDEVVLHSGHLNSNQQSRNTWEAQVFLLNEEGRYAIRATNALGGDSGWSLAATTYWTVNAGAEGPLAEYSFEKSYIWNIEPYVQPDAVVAPSATPATPLPAAYDLNGRPTPHISRGLHIIGGRKVMVK